MMHLQGTPKLLYPRLSTILLVLSCHLLQELFLHHQPTSIQGHRLFYLVRLSGHPFLSSDHQPNLLKTITAEDLNSWIKIGLHRQSTGFGKTMFIAQKCTLVVVQSSDVM